MAAASCPWNQPLPVLLGRPAVSPLVDRTFLHFGGLPQAFAPLEPLRIPGEDVATAGLLENCTVRANDTSPWVRAAADARAGGPLRLVVLGTSPTTGCGSAEDVAIAAYEPGPQHNRSMGFSRHCDPTRSWGRHLRDFLVRLLGPLAPEVSINSKNAASAVWFARCCHERVPRDAHIVLLEVLTNVFGGDLKMLLRAVRHAAPSAAIAFVMWPSFGSMRTHRDVDHTAMLAAADSEGADAVDIKRLLVKMQHASQEHVPTFYAQGGNDKVHPNPGAHQLIGAVVARYVARRLIDARAIDCSTAEDRRTARPPATGEERISTPSPVDTPTETCYDSAELLPVKKPVHGFALADEGGDKGVRKMGYISRQVGDELVLGPIPYLSQRECTMASVSVGYLLSSTNQNQGAFHISCKGCKCSPIHNPFQKELYPFPMVQTDARMMRNPAFRENNISITTNTEFWAIMTPTSPCFVILTHAHSKHLLENSSRVRIDSFSVAELDDGMLGYAERRGSGTHRLMVQIVRNNCTGNLFTNISW